MAQCRQPERDKSKGERSGFCHSSCPAFARPCGSGGKSLTSSPFSSTEAFRQHFGDGLDRLLREYDELGTFVLVLANAHFDVDLWRRLRTPLTAKFNQLSAELNRSSPIGLMLDDAGDDLRVFRQLMSMGLARLSDHEQRREGPWELQFNPLRALRPPRMAEAVIGDISAPFDVAGFNFNKPFLRKEILWEGWLCGRNSTLFFNKFPFVELHGLLVPERRRGWPQLLQRGDNDYLWRLTEVLAETLQGVGFGYNSYGACASVNHLHFQMFQRKEHLPVADPDWQHNGGSREYPLPCHVFDDAGRAWRFVCKLHATETSYNLVYLPGRLYCLPRRRQGEDLHAPWSSGFAWYDLAGGFTLFDQAHYQRLQQHDLAAALAQLEMALPFR